MRAVSKQVFILPLLLSVFETSAQLVDSSFPASSKEYAQTISNDFTKYAQNIFLPVLTDKEKLIANDIQYLYINTVPFDHVGAIIKNGRRLVGINVGAYVRLQYLSEAFFLSVADQNQPFFDGYLIYLARAGLLGPKIFTPKEYANLYGLDSMVSKVENLSTDEKRKMEEIFDDFIAHLIGHEIAHHVLGHLTSADQTKAAVRLRESDADEWATKRMVQAGRNPIYGALTMLMFNEQENRSAIRVKSSTHPASLTRAVSITDVTVSALEQEKKNFVLGSGGGEFAYESVLRFSKSLRTALQKKKLEQDYMDKGTLKDVLWMAKKGDRYYQIEMGNALLPKEKDPQRPGFIDQVATDQVIFWYRTAAENPAKFDYFYSTVADYQFGSMLAFRKGVARDDVLSCKHLERAAKRDYFPAVHAYDTLQKAGRCG